MRLTPGAALLLLTFRLVGGLNFAPSAMTNRITEYATVAVMIPVGLVGILLSIVGLRWLVTACWPGRVAIVADATGITFRLGPMGTAHHRINDIDMRYPFENDDDEDDDLPDESLLSPEEQMAYLLPKMTCANQIEPLDRLIVRYAGATEHQLAAELKPFIEYARSNQPPPRP
jgi:hypothetical protein